MKPSDNAFPEVHTDSNSPVIHSTGGLTMREYFAAAALTGLLTCYTKSESIAMAPQVADALIAELSKPDAK